jgi:hypothetical protein
VIGLRQRSRERIRKVFRACSNILLKRGKFVGNKCEETRKGKFCV